MTSQDSASHPIGKCTSGTPTGEVAPSAAVSELERADAKTPLLAPMRSEETDQDRAAATIVEIQPTPALPVTSTKVLGDSAVPLKLFEKGVMTPTGNQSAATRETDSPVEPLDDQRTLIETIDQGAIKTPGTGFPGFASTLAIRRREVSSLGQPAASDVDFEIIRELGRGGMGKVYLARQRSLDRSVAIKVIKPSVANNLAVRESFLAEAVITGALEHPNIVPIYELCSNHNGESFYAMKEVRGTPWSKIIGTNSEAENLDILLRVADAIGFAHARGVVHRDLKPDNVMIGEFGEVLVMDWGLALPTPDFHKPNAIRHSGPAGTPQYMAPEMAAGNVELIGPLSDVYLLGALLFRSLVGKSPHAGSNARKCLEAAIRNEIVPTDRHDDLMAIALTAMATQPADRYPSAKAFQAAIREFQAHASSLALAIHAEAELQNARESGTYRTFEKALIEFEEALRLWDGNARASAGLSRARFDYAITAFERKDYDLAAEQLDDSHPVHAELLGRIHAAKEESASRLERIRWLKRVTAGLAVVIFVTVSVAGMLIHRAWRHEQAAFAEALTRFRQSQQAIARITPISDQIRHLPRLQAVRKNLLEMVASYYQELTDSPSQNPDMQLELARSLVRLGDVHSVLSEHREAIQSWDKAARFSEPLRSTKLADDVITLARQIRVRSAASDRALHDFLSARQRLEPTLAELRQAGPASRLELASALFQLGLLWKEMGLATSAIDTLREAEAIYQQLAETGTETLAQRGWATTLSTLGQLLQRSGEFDLAANKIKQSLAIWSKLYELDASNPELLEGVATSQIDLANALRGAGHEPAAVYEEAIAAYAELARAQPEIPHYEFNLAAVRMNLASLFNRRGESEPAKAVAVEGINGFIRLANQYPEDSRYQDREVEARITLAEVLRDRHELELAHGTLEEATSHLDQRIAEHDLPQYREQQALMASLRGQLHTLSTDFPKAREQFEAAIVLWEQLLRQDSAQSSRYRDSAAWTRFHLAAVLQESAEPAAAKTQVEAAIRIREQLPANAVWDESFAWLLLHNAEPSQSQTTRAATLAQRAADAASDNPRMWRTLALAQLRNQRLVDCRQSLKRSRELGQDSSGEQLFLESLLAVAMGDHDTARKHYQRADEQMQQTVPGSSRLRTLKSEATSAQVEKL